MRRTTGKPPKRILLVGGLGSSRYLHRQLQKHFGNVIQPQRAWSAVARGAVIKLLKTTFSQQQEWVTAATDPQLGQLLINLPEVESRISRLSYGVESGVPVERAFPPVDRAVDRTSVDPDGTLVVWRMKWYLRQVGDFAADLARGVNPPARGAQKLTASTILHPQGETISNRDPVTVAFYEYVASAAARQTTFKLLTSSSETPPVRRDGSARPLCVITCDYDTPFDELPLVDPGRGIRRVDGMNLTMRFDGEPEWRLQVGQNTTERRVDVQFA